MEFTTKLQRTLLNRRTIQAIVWFIIFGVLLYLAAVFWLGWKDVMSAFAALGLNTLLIGALLSSSSYLWRFGRWEYSLRCLGYKVPRFAHLIIYLSGLALTATPGKAGETFRSALLLRYDVRVSHSLAAFLADRGSDVLGMILLGIAATTINEEHITWVWLAFFLLILLGSKTFAYLILQPVTFAKRSSLARYMAWLPVKSGWATLEAWAKIWTLPRILIFSAIAMIAYGTQALIFFWFCYVLETDISVADCVLIFISATLLGAASMLPGGLGVMEAAILIQLIERDVSYSTSVSLAISIRFVTLWVGMLLGVLSMATISNKDKKIRYV